MQNPIALLATSLRRPAPKAVVPASPRPIAPYMLPGYKTPERMTAVDYTSPEARWPLVWVMDISSYDAVSHRVSGQASFSLSNAQARMQCQVPLGEGRLFDKEGAYVIVAVPAEDEEQVHAILSLAGR